MRDASGQSTAIGGGLWGVKNLHRHRAIFQRLVQAENVNTTYGKDQIALYEIVYKSMHKNTLAHASVSCENEFGGETVRPFPNRRENNSFINYIGAGKRYKHFPFGHAH